MKKDCRNDCVEPLRFPRLIDNRASLSHIGYRIGTYSDIWEYLRRNLDKTAELAKWTHRGADDPGLVKIAKSLKALKWPTSTTTPCLRPNLDATGIHHHGFRLRLTEALQHLSLRGSNRRPVSRNGLKCFISSRGAGRQYPYKENREESFM